ncbi:MAG: AMP-binding protein [Microbacteriaceae bacterium]|nr:AMP-binding protein [Microbacteriaceae bacterium]
MSNYVSLLDENLDGLHTLSRWTTQQYAQNPGKVAIDDRGVTLTYRELHKRSERLAEKLVNAGYAIGDRIATICGNSADQVVLFFACAKAGVILAPLSWRLSPREIAAQLQILEPSLLVADSEFESLALSSKRRFQTDTEETLPLQLIGSLGVEQEVAAPAGKSERSSRRAISDDDAMLILFTSGTQGNPKGVVLTHSNCFWTNLSLSLTIPVTTKDVILAMLPQFHVGGWNILPLLAWWTGATVVLEPTFDPPRVLKLISERQVTSMMAVPTQYLMLATDPAFKSADLSSLRHAIVGGASMPSRLIEIWHDRGVGLTQGYGLTEGGPNVLCLPENKAKEKIGFSGRPYPHMEAALRDPDTGLIVQGTGVGELICRGPGVSRAYFNAQDEFDKNMIDGWLRTGDLAYRDDEGDYRIIDRIKDIYISGGENISPAEVEAAIITFPEVTEVAVLGIPDEKWGEVGFAFVVGKAEISEADLIEHLGSRIAGYKIPKYFKFISQIPKSGTNKISRPQLREMAVSLLKESAL